MEPTIDAYTMAHVAIGEAGVCAPIVWLAVMNVMSRNKRMNGWSDDVPGLSVALAAAWDKLPDTSGGATFMFSGDDLLLPQVQNIITKEARDPPIVYECAGGLSLYFYQSNDIPENKPLVNNKGLLQ